MLLKAQSFSSAQSLGSNLLCDLKEVDGRVGRRGSRRPGVHLEKTPHSEVKGRRGRRRRRQRRRQHRWLEPTTGKGQSSVHRRGICGRRTLEEWLREDGHGAFIGVASSRRGNRALNQVANRTNWHQQLNGEADRQKQVKEIKTRGLTRSRYAGGSGWCPSNGCFATCTPGFVR